MDKNFSPEKIRELLAKWNLGAEPKWSDGPKVAFLPEGQHKIRFFFDPEGELYREVVGHQVNKRVIHCLDHFAEQNPNKMYPPCDFCRFAQETNDWRLQQNLRYLVYGYLHETNRENQYWQAGHAYVMVGTYRMWCAVGKMLKTLAKQEASDYLVMMLNPGLQGPLTSVDVEKGLQGYVSINPVPGRTIPALELGAWYRPLADCWLPQEPDMEEYQHVLAAYCKNNQDGGAPLDR
jgi:hypothetical protein